MGKRGMRGIRKSTFREIRSSLGRFMAIFAIIALGVGFFAGLKVTKEAMLATVKGYLDRHAFYDLRLISTLGFGPENTDAFAGAKDVEAAEGSVSFDMIYSLEDGSQGVAKIHSLPEELNTPKLTAGRMPQESNECVADNNLFGKSDIGTVISLAEDNAEEDLEHFTHKEYTIVGLVQSPLYIQYERGNTSLGTGRLAGFLYLPPEGFTVEYFTEVYVRFSQDFDLYSTEYNSFMDGKERSFERTAKEEADKRYQEIRREAEQKIADGYRELEEKEEEGLRELEAAGKELDEAARQLEEGERALADARLEFAEGEQELFNKEGELIQARITLSEKEQELYQGEVTITEKEAELVEARSLIDSNEVELRSAERQLADGKAELRSKSESVETMRNLVTEGRNQLELQEKELERQKEELRTQAESGAISGEAYDLAVSMIEKGEQTLGEYRARLEELEGQLAAGEEELAAGPRFFPGLEAMRWHPDFVDVIAPGGGKDQGMDAILAHFGIPLEATMAFGDGENDLPMLRHAHIGVAMGNAGSYVKSHADYVTGTVDEDGILAALEHFGLL